MPELTIATQSGEPLLSIDLSNRQKLTFGRSPRCDVRLRGAAVSRHHALLIEESGRWMLIDLSGRNDTYLGDEPVRSAVASNDEPIRIGDLYLWFEGLGEGLVKPPALPAPPDAIVRTRAAHLEQLWRHQTLRPARRAVA